MARPPSDILTERESQIMEVLWSVGEATAERVRESLAGQPHEESRVLADAGGGPRPVVGKQLRRRIHRPPVYRRRATHVVIDR